MKIYKMLEKKLSTALVPEHLEIMDESNKHKGHSGYRHGGETHFAVTIISDKFTGMSRIARHKKVYDILREEMQLQIHALSITALTPEESSNK